MKKTSLHAFAIAITLLIGAGSIHAGVSDYISNLDYGVKANVSLSQLSNQNKAKNQTGFGIEGIASYQYTDNFSIETGLGIDMRGYAVDIKDTKATKTNYIQVPVSARYQFPQQVWNANISAIGGGYASYLLSADNDGKDVKSSYENIDYGVRFGVAANIQQFNVEVAYDLGLSKVASVTDTNSKTVDGKNRSIRIAGSYQF